MEDPLEKVELPETPDDDSGQDENDADITLQDPTNPLNKDPVLDEETQARLLFLWNSRPLNPPSIKELCREAWGEDIDPREKRGRIVRKFFSQRKIKIAVQRGTYVKKDIVVLTDNQKEFITNHCNTKPTQLVQILFNIDEVNPNCLELVAVTDFLKTIHHKNFFDTVNNVPGAKYSPPETIHKVIDKINKYTSANYSLKSMTSSQKKNAQSLMNYLCTMRFKTEIDSYDTQDDKDLFESGFIRCTYNKGDLTEEEQDQYVMYSSEVVSSFSLNKSIMAFEAKAIEERDSEDGKLHTALAEHITNLRKDYRESTKIQQNLLKTLDGTRSERISKHRQETASVLNLVELWKAEETRKQQIEMAQKRKEKLEEEFNKLNTFADVRAKILGIDLNEILNG